MRSDKSLHKTQIVDTSIPNYTRIVKIKTSYFKFYSFLIRHHCLLYACQLCSKHIPKVQNFLQKIRFLSFSCVHSEKRIFTIWRLNISHLRNIAIVCTIMPWCLWNTPTNVMQWKIQPSFVYLPLLKLLLSQNFKNSGHPLPTITRQKWTKNDRAKIRSIACKKKEQKLPYFC